MSFWIICVSFLCFLLFADLFDFFFACFHFHCDKTWKKTTKNNVIMFGLVLPLKLTWLGLVQKPKYLATKNLVGLMY